MTSAFTYIIVAILDFTLLIIFWFNSNIIAILIYLILNAVVLYKSGIFGQNKIKFECEELLDNLLSKSNSTSIPKLKLLEQSLNKKFIFSKDFSEAIKYYKLSGSIDRFNKINTHNSFILKRLIEDLTASFSKNLSIQKRLNILREDYKRTDNYNKIASSIVSSSKKMSLIGELLFLPLFAGISYDILKFTSFGGTREIYILPILMILYFLISSWIENLHSNLSNSFKTYKIAFYTSFSSFIMIIASMLITKIL